MMVVEVVHEGMTRFSRERREGMVVSDLTV